jgi:hypothetical protein
MIRENAQTDAPTAGHQSDYMDAIYGYGRTVRMDFNQRAVAATRG